MSPQLLICCETQHDFVILDLPHTFDEITLAAFDDADDILVVTTLDIMAVRNMQRVVSALERLDCPREKIRAVVNRWSKGDLDVGQAQIERLFSKNLMTLIPND
jgi:pilus assembly protein CpaE